MNTDDSKKQHRIAQLMLAQCEGRTLRSRERRMSAWDFKKVEIPLMQMAYLDQFEFEIEGEYPDAMTDDAKRLHLAYLAQDEGPAGYDQIVAVRTIAQRLTFQGTHSNAIRQVQAFLQHKCVRCVRGLTGKGLLARCDHKGGFVAAQAAAPEPPTFTPAASYQATSTLLRWLADANTDQPLRDAAAAEIDARIPTPTNEDY